MPSQVVQLSAHILASVRDLKYFTKAVAFGSHDAELREGATADGGIAFRVILDSLVYCPGERSPFSDDTYALALVPTGSSGVFPPRDLPLDVTLAALDLTEKLLLDLTEWSGHDQLEIVGAFAVAREGAATGIERPSRIPNAGEAAILVTAASIQATLGNRLSLLAGKLTSYQAMVTASGISSVIPRLSLQAELGANLRIRRGKRQFLPAPQHDVSRRTLRCFTRAAHNGLAAHQRLAEAIHLAGLRGENWLTPALLHDLHALLLRDRADEHQAGELKQDETWIVSRGCSRPIRMPIEGLAEAVAVYCRGFDATLWREVHPLIRAGLGYLGFLRLGAYQDGVDEIAWLLLHGFLMEAGLPPLPWEYLLHWLQGSFLAARKLAIQRGDDAAFLRYLIAVSETGMAIGRRMVKVMKPEYARVLAGMLTKNVSATLAQKAAEFTCSMVLGPDPQAVRRTVHAMELSFQVGTSLRFDRIDATALAFTLSGYESPEIWSNRVARKLMRKPMPAVTF